MNIISQILRLSIGKINFIDIFIKIIDISCEIYQF